MKIVLIRLCSSISQQVADNHWLECRNILLDHSLFSIYILFTVRMIIIIAKISPCPHSHHSLSCCSMWRGYCWDQPGAVCLITKWFRNYSFTKNLPTDHLSLNFNFISCCSVFPHMFGIRHIDFNHRTRLYLVLNTVCGDQSFTATAQNPSYVNANLDLSCQTSIIFQVKAKDSMVVSLTKTLNVYTTDIYEFYIYFNYIMTTVYITWGF